MCDKPNSPEKRFRTGPRFIPEDDLVFHIDEVIQEAFSVAADSPIDVDSGDPDAQEAIYQEFECGNLAERSATSILYDSFASESDFIGSAKRALDSWQSSLARSWPYPKTKNWRLLKDCSPIKWKFSASNWTPGRPQWN